MTMYTTEFGKGSLAGTVEVSLHWYHFTNSYRPIFHLNLMFLALEFGSLLNISFCFLEVASNSFTLKDSSGAVTSSIYPFKLIPFASGPISLVELGWYLDYELPFLFLVSLDRRAKVLPGQPPPSPKWRVKLSLRRSSTILRNVKLVRLRETLMLQTWSTIHSCQCSLN